jgi:hypothetical protein
MIVVETVVAGILYVLPTRRTMFQDLQYVTSRTVNCFQIASGSSLEAQLSHEIEDMPGVRSVNVRRTENDGLEVSVLLENLEFSTYERVIQKELDLYDKFPDMPVKFNVDLCVAPEEPALVYYVA